jgi:transposase
MQEKCSNRREALLKINFSEEEISQLRQEHLEHEHSRVRRRCEVVYLKSLEFSHQDIGRLVGVSQPTLRSYMNMYKNGGIEKLKELNFYRPVSKLEVHREKLKTEFTSNPPKSVNEAMKRIEKLTGILRSPTQVRQFIKRLGLKRLKVGQIPAKADPEKQKFFSKKNLNLA